MSKIDKIGAPYSHLALEPYTPNIGAVIRDLDLVAATSDENVRAELRRALAEYQVLFLRNQTITPEQQVDIARIFGDPDKAKSFFPRHDGVSLIELIKFAPGGHRYRTDQWHADISFSQNPPTGVVLYSHDIPPFGGDTVWASATRVYDALPDHLKAYLEELEGLHSFESSEWPDYFHSQPEGIELYRKARADYLPAVHKLAPTHPLTGRKLIYANPNFTYRIKGLRRQESDALLTYLFAQFERPEVQARWRWENNTVAIWDNRATVHYAVGDYYPAPRLLHRVTFGEDQAF